MHVRGLAFLLILTSLLSGCTLGRANARVAFWQKESERHLPPGTPLADAQAFFVAHGLKLDCCMSGPDIVNAYSASERDVGRLLWMRYSVLIVVDLDNRQSVSQVRVFRIGLGP